MRTHYVLKQFEFKVGKFRSLTFSDSTKIKLATANEQSIVPKFSDTVDRFVNTDALILIYNETTQEFPTDTDLYVTSWQTRPEALKEFVGFAVDAEIPTNTTVTFQLIDNGTAVYWDGAAWSAASATDWNTETEIHTNISSFSPTGKNFGTIVKLYSLDGLYTPYVHSVNFVMECFCSWEQEILYRTVVPALKTIQINTRLVVEMAEDSTTYDISSAFGDKNYSVTDVVACYDYTDTYQETDIFSSYVAGTVTFTSEQAEGTQILMYVTVASSAIVQSQSRDYDVLPMTLPCFVISGFDIAERITMHDTLIVNQSVPWAANLKDGKSLTYEVSVEFYSGSGVDNLVMQDAVSEYFAQTKFLTLSCVDEKINIVLTSDDIEMNKTMANNELHGSGFKFKIYHFPFYGDAEIDANLIQTVNIEGSLVE